MKKFIIRLSDSHGHVYELCAEVQEEDVDILREKIKKELTIKDTYSHSRNGVNYPAKNPEIIKQLKQITNYDFVGFEPDVVLSYGGESLLNDDLPGYIRY